MKKPLVITIIFLAVLAYALVVLSAKDKPSSNEKPNQDNVGNIILFYGDGCPHCKIVEEYVEANGIEAKVPFTKKEVYYNKANSAELGEKAIACGMPTDSIGVPFLWDGAQCYVGDQDIIEYFKDKSE